MSDQPALLAAVRAGRPWRGELLHRHRQGHELWVSATLTPVTIEATGEHFLVAVEEDVTERRVYQAQLERAKALAEQANRAKSEFLSAMSHELRTPMNSILGFAQLLLCGGPESLSPRQRGYLERIASGGDHLMALINDVLDLARVETGTLRLSLEAVELPPVIESALSMVETAAAEGRVTLVLPAFGRTLPAVRADSIRLRQVLLNLLSNAVKYNRPGGSVTLSAALVESGRLRLTVSDTGRGIPAQRWPELFQPFHRLGLEASGIEGTGSNNWVLSGTKTITGKMLAKALERVIADKRKHCGGIAIMVMREPLMSLTLTSVVPGCCASSSRRRFMLSCVH